MNHTTSKATVVAAMIWMAAGEAGAADYKKNPYTLVYEDAIEAQTQTANAFSNRMVPTNAKWPRWLRELIVRARRVQCSTRRCRWAPDLYRRPISLVFNGLSCDEFWYQQRYQGKITAIRVDTPARRRRTHVSLTWRFDSPITRGLCNVSG